VTPGSVAPGSSPGRLDPRLSVAVAASHGWYRDVFAVHEIPTRESDGLWSALGVPPRWHSAAKTLRPGVPVDRVVGAVRRFGDCSVADSFGDLPLHRLGFERLIDARWVFREPTRSSASGLAPGWSIVSDVDELGEWNTAHDTTGVLVAALLEHPRFSFLACHEGSRLVAGAVLHESGAVVELSNTWSTSGGDVDLAAVLRCVEALHPERAVVGYAQGDDLDESLANGFADVGPQVVWRRSA
jgi:hypothetical protein